LSAEPAAAAVAARLPWLDEAIGAALSSSRGHATLVHAAPGIGAFEFALELARGWLCESRGRDAPIACGHCGSCRLIDGRVHPDLFVLLPEAQRRSRGWPLAGDKPDGDDGKRKPSRQIRVDEVRSLIDWSHKTAARGQGKVALLHPAEAINTIAASALLKTLEEPAPGTRIVLTAADPALLLPTVLSRCQRFRLPAPDSVTAARWLADRGTANPQALLAAHNGRPLDALASAQAGIDAAAWAALPRAVAAGQAAALAGFGVAQAVDALHKLCHDALAASVGALPRYFGSADLPDLRSGTALPALLAWARELDRVARDAEHPWNEPLLLEALVAQGHRALSPLRTTAGPPPRSPGRGHQQGADTLGR
jgi:DNA polymerase III subunit delta'